MKRLTRLLAPLCVFALQQPLWAQDSAAPSELVAIDLRPSNEKEGTGLLPLTGKCNKGVFRIADVASDPVKVEALRSDLARQLGLAGDGKTLMVLNWSVYYNTQAAHGGASKLESVGIQGYSIPTKKKEKQVGSKCSREESGGGWYQGSDVNTSLPPIISEFSGTFAGKPYNVRTVYSLRRSIEGKFAGSEDDTEALLEAVHQAAEALATAIVK